MKKFLLGIGGFFVFIIILAAFLPGPWAWNFGTILGHITYAIAWPFMYEPQSTAGRLIQILFIWALIFTIPILIVKFISYLKRKTKKTEVKPLKIEQELRAKFPLLENYFNDVFKWLRKEVKNKHEALTAAAKTKGVLPENMPYVLLFFQVTEQLKSGEWYVHRGMLNMQGEDMYALWKYLLEKLEQYKYFPAEDFTQRRKEMTEWIKTNG